MSIFKFTFKRYVLKQIKARQSLLQTAGRRPIEFQQYVSAKSPWVKMTSFVDYDKNYDLKNPNYIPKYTIDLAKNNILYGGTPLTRIAPDGSVQNAMRFGVQGDNRSNRRSAYGSDQWKTENNQYGLVPMPGISKIQVDTVSAYGSLRQATVTFYTWNLKQLEDLEILYMRPFYPILLEWGWSLYLDTYDETDESEENEHKIDNIIVPIPKIKKDFLTINPFASNLDQEKIYKQLESKRKKYCGNYDGLLGFVKNFNRRLLDNGGYECTVTLISLGEIIPSLRSNYATGTHTEGENIDTETETGAKQKQHQFFKDHFETLINHLMTGTKIKNADLNIIDEKLKKSIYKDKIDFNVYEISSTNTTAGEDTMVNNCYIQLGYFLAILEYESNLYEAQDKGIISIELPFNNIKGNKGNGLCLAGKNTISVDPITCIIRNTFTEVFSNTINKNLKGYSYDTIIKDAYKTGRHREINSFVNLYSKSGIYYGEIGNIYICLNKFADSYKLEINKTIRVSWDTVMKDILKTTSAALGGINDFDVYSEDNKYVIFDKFYIEAPQNTKKETKALINIIGNNTTVRTHNIETRIFESQASMFAIAAQDRYNVSSIETTTVSYLNKGLKSRILTERLTKDALGIEEQKNEVEKILGSELREIQVILEQYYFRNKIPNDYSTNILPTLVNFLNSILIRVDGASNFKAIIPITLEITIDGLTGFVIGEIFRVNSDSLPREYHGKAIGFIVTKISHTVEKGDWKTVLGTQVCLLDQEFLADSFINYTINEKDLIKAADVQSNENKKIDRLQTIYYNILVSFIHDFNNAVLYDGLSANTFAYSDTGYGEKLRNITPILYTDKDFITNSGTPDKPYYLPRGVDLNEYFDGEANFKKLLNTIRLFNYTVDGKNSVSYALEEFYKPYVEYIRAAAPVGRNQQSVLFISIPIKLLLTSDISYLELLDATIKKSSFYINLKEPIKSLFDRYYAEYSDNVKKRNSYTFYILEDREIFYNINGRLKPLKQLIDIIDADKNKTRTLIGQVDAEDFVFSNTTPVQIRYRKPLRELIIDLLNGL